MSVYLVLHILKTVTLKANVIDLNLFQFFGNPKRININSDSKFRFNIVEGKYPNFNLKKNTELYGQLYNNYKPGAIVNLTVT